jgi:hypothetical protein
VFGAVDWMLRMTSFDGGWCEPGCKNILVLDSQSKITGIDREAIFLDAVKNVVDEYTRDNVNVNIDIREIAKDLVSITNPRNKPKRNCTLQNHSFIYLVREFRVLSS